jgi:hypothetical protein
MTDEVVILDKEGNRLRSLTAADILLLLGISDVTYGDLIPGSEPDGTEFIAALQGDDGVKLTAQQISGDAVSIRAGLGKNVKRGYCDFTGVRKTATGTNGGLFENEPFLTAFAGTAAGVSNLALFLFSPTIALSTGTDTTGYAALDHTDWPVTAVPDDYSLSVKTQVLMVNLPAGGNAFTVQTGFTFNSPGLATYGMYFELTSASTHWFGVVNNNGTTTKVDTGIVASTTTPQVLSVVYDHVTEATYFLIDGDVVQFVLNTTQVVPTGTRMTMSTTIIKSSGATAGQIIIFRHEYENGIPVIEHF